MNTDVHTVEIESEEDRVVRWRVQRLLAAGFDGEAALILGLDQSVDLHEAVALLAAGCSQELALQILL
jgi:hypothetical protein